jgi:hypothetical protein
VTSEDRVRDLCAQALAAENDEALDRIIPQLRAALHELMATTEYPFHKDVVAD